MKTVWKYELDLVDEAQNRPMPRGASVLAVAVQTERLCMWVEVNSGYTLEDRWFVVEGTGHPLLDDADYIGSALMHGGALVWHVYEQSMAKAR